MALPCQKWITNKNRSKSYRNIFSGNAFTHTSDSQEKYIGWHHNGVLQKKMELKEKRRKKKIFEAFSFSLVSLTSVENVTNQ
jgi:hypothetical protein